ncbi:DUF2231 domain-containing protein [Nocardia sp. CA-151230]|uniref:DUF2231 domain-containing protein n=1 Tax=Nocardia sp. CA-151230 TaxID=3239982 RepID=UPI003D8B6F7D
MGPNTINGLPAHVLLVHAVVVLVPLTALLLILAVVWPAARRRIGVVLPVVAFVTLVFVPLTTHSGEWLEHHTPRDPLVRIHTHLGDDLLVWSAGTFLLAAVWWAIHDEHVRERLRRRVPRIDAMTARRALSAVLAVVALGVAAGSVVQVYRIGDSGAKAAWHERADQLTAAADDRTPRNK